MKIDINIGDFQIRSFRETDIPAMVHHANNRKIARNMRNIFPHPYTTKDATDWIRLVKSLPLETEFSIASSKETIGGIGLEFLSDVHFKTAGLGYWLGESFWGKGIMTQAVIAFTEYAFSTYDLVRIFAHVFEKNPASARVLEKAGYTCEGRLKKNAIKNGKILDQFLYAKVR